MLVDKNGWRSSEYLKQLKQTYKVNWKGDTLNFDVNQEKCLDETLKNLVNSTVTPKKQSSFNLQMCKWMEQMNGLVSIW